MRKLFIFLLAVSFFLEINVVAESRYRALDSLDGQGGRQTRSASENDEYATLGEGEAARWQRLSALGFTGASGSFRERLPYSG